jgi:hypothetical protein
METQLKIIGCLLMTLAFIHIFFPRYFRWKEELKSLSLINRQMMMVHAFFIALVVFLMGLLCFTLPRELIETNLGRVIALGLGVFWGVRLIFQLLVYSPQLWKNKRFETAIHVLFSLLWIYFSGIFLWAGLG